MGLKTYHQCPTPCGSCVPRRVGSAPSPGDGMDLTPPGYGGLSWWCSTACTLAAALSPARTPPRPQANSCVGLQVERAAVGVGAVVSDCTKLWDGPRKLDAHLFIWDSLMRSWTSERRGMRAAWKPHPWDPEGEGWAVACSRHCLTLAPPWQGQPCILMVPRPFLDCTAGHAPGA